MDTSKFTNEQWVDFILKCKDDFLFFCENVLFIQDKYSNRIPLKLNSAQRALYSKICSIKEKGKPIRIIILKARQMGITTFLQAFMYHDISTKENRNILVAAQDASSVEEIFNKQHLFYKCSPKIMQPMRKFSNKKQIYFGNPKDSPFLGLESRVTVETADKAEMGRSKTLQGAHLSEFAFWEGLGFDPSKRLNALHNAIPMDYEDSYIFIETTAQGEGFFKDLWDNEDTNYEKVFLSWIADDGYSMPCSEDDIVPLSNTKDSIYGDEYDAAYKIEAQVRYWKSELSEDEIVDEILARLNWRRFCIKHQCQNSWQLFDQEYPTSPEDAFIASGSSIFNVETLNFMLKNSKDPIYFKFDIQAFAELWKEDISLLDDNKKQDSIANLFIESEMKKPVVLFEYPKKQSTYVVGADAAEGVQGGDFSSFVVYDLDGMEEVASYNGLIDPNNFAYLLSAIGYLYNKALIGCEDNDKGGGVTNNTLAKTILYSNLYIRKKLMTRKDNRENYYGWKTTPITKPKLVADMYTYLENEEIRLNNKDLLNQLKLIKLFDDGTIGAPKPYHDDIAMASMIGLQMGISGIIKKEFKKDFKPTGITMRQLIESMEIRDQGKSIGATYE